ncbi:MAG: hypothetical protein A2174_02495 [Candidatus Portnoybacteria bacterium RBG_13_41_18]|uniref:Leucine--tRNA ligase n=1 Tax=Candidatus Portnoybacteria bacterium RBG_13_41_18 TaxID=1801991 RepID=A0A1G2FBJ3_9BACT|nr:MAG: hypothetical protein A2174_02495 [Candidatus Portnoybacteria bacterium RBG_13_41_18]
MDRYNPNKIEKKWQKFWEKNKINNPNLDKAKKPFYNLMMFPYSSAEGLHVGNMYAFVHSDTYGRFIRFRGFDVFEPIGLDGFGIHSENYAIKQGEHILDVSKRTEKHFYEQLHMIGNQYDWTRHLETYRPEYYKWTQWIFVQMFKKGLAYQAESYVNWCPSCKTVLSDEQVISGKCERCGTLVEKKLMKQWFFKITDYAERLLKNLERINWSERTKIAQKNWIGKSQGAQFKMKVVGSNQLVAKYDQILLATNNLSKKARVEKLLKAIGVKTKILTPKDLGLETVEAKEDGDLFENAKEKAELYRGKTNLPILGIDTGFFMPGEEIDPVKVKRNALDGRNERKLSQEEIGKLIHEYYKKIVRKRGRKVDAYWQDVAALSLPDGAVNMADDKREVIITDQVKGEIDMYFPLRSLYISKATGKYIADQTEADELIEQGPFIETLKKLLCVEELSVEVFTTRLDTVFGMTFALIAPEHELVQKLKPQITNWNEVEKYINDAKKKSELQRVSEVKEKTGVELKGIKIINPFTKKAIPLFASDFVLAHYGTGAVMAVPAHDERDWEFAKKYRLPIREVVIPEGREVIGVGALIRDKEGKFIFQERDAKTNINPGMITPFGGAIEKGESDLDALVREIGEELNLEINRLKTFVIGRFKSHAFQNKYINLFYIDDINSKKIKIQEGKEIVNFSLEEALSNSKVTEFTKNVIKYFRSKRNFAYVEDGVLSNSREYDHMTSAEAREKLIEWLEKNKIGSRKINYKLRDWCISRQRYWGPPIPIIYCDKCATKKEQVLFLHGWEDDSQSGVTPELKKNLESKGYDFYAFDAPNTKEPQFEEWFSFIKRKIKENKLKNFHLIGHSMGGHLAAKIAEKYKLRSLYLFAPVGFKPPEEYFERFQGILGIKEIEIFKKYQDRNLDVKKVKNNVEKIEIIFGEKDHWISEEIREFYFKNFKDFARINILKGYGHMSKDEGVSKILFLEDLFCDSHPGTIPIPEKDLPVLLPKTKDYLPWPDGLAPLARNEKFVKTKCPKCGGPARRETDVSDTFLDSAWYFFRYPSVEFNKNIFNKKRTARWLPVDMYIGGNEHAVLHLLYSRFMTMFFKDLGLIDFEEPYKRFFAHGLLIKEGAKMSKSRGNVINPDVYIKQYGADSVRMYLLFLGDVRQGGDWRDAGMNGMYKFINRIWHTRNRIVKQESGIKNNEIEILLNKTIKKIGEDLEGLKFNTAISALMIFVNALEKEKEMSKSHFSKFLILLSPFAPHIAEELWNQLGHKKSIFIEKWPEYDPVLVRDKIIELIIQINGKVRAKISVPADISEAEVRKLSLSDSDIKKWLEGREPKKMIFVRGRLVNIVV